MVLSETAGAREVGVDFLRYLVIEFASGSKSTRLGLPWEFHDACRAAFQVSCCGWRLERRKPRGVGGGGGGGGGGCRPVPPSSQAAKCNVTLLLFFSGVVARTGR